MRIHIGFHFYGAGNIGDDLMLEGFLGFLRSFGCNPHITCAIPHDIDSQRLRFPEIEWMPCTEEARRAAVSSCDFWLGVGDTPFQSDSGNWLLDHLAGEMDLMREFSKPGFMICVGVNNRAATRHPVSLRLLDEMNYIWTRDIGSANLLAEVASWNKLMPAADLAHLVFEPTSARFSQGPGEPLIMVIAAEDESQLGFDALSEVILRWDGPVYWYCQEVRDFPGVETPNFAKLSEAARNKAEFIRPDYAVDNLEKLIGVFDRAGVCLTSRYHSAVTSAWKGLRTAVFSRNDKLASATAQMGLTPVCSLSDAEVMLDALHRATRADPARLVGLRHSSRMACESLFRILES